METIICSNYENPSDVALSFDKVLSARSIDVDGITLTALLTAPIYLKSERDALLSDISAAIKEAFGGDCLVTMDTEIYRKIKPDIPENLKRALLEKAEARQKHNF